MEIEDNADVEERGRMNEERKERDVQKSRNEGEHHNQTDSE